LELPYLNAQTFRIFIDAFVEAFSESLNFLLLENSGACTTQRPRWPTNVRAVWLPPYRPELNSMERVGRSGRSIVTCLRSSPPEPTAVVSRAPKATQAWRFRTPARLSVYHTLLGWSPPHHPLSWPWPSDGRDHGGEALRHRPARRRWGGLAQAAAEDS
jgi:hypothetical protein